MKIILGVIYMLTERQDAKFNEDHIAIIDIDHARLEDDWA